MNTLRFWIRFLFTVLTFLLLVAFVLRILAPGNPETAILFQKIQFIQPWLDQACAWLVLPISYLLDWVNPHLPATWRAWFPISPAGPFFSLVSSWLLKIPGLANSPFGAQLQTANFSLWFPGVMDWRLLLALPIWGFVESLILKFLIYIEAGLYRFSLRQRDADMVKSLQQQVQASSGMGQFRPVVTNVPPEANSAGASDSHDFLTGLYSQPYFEFRLGKEMEAARLSQSCMSLLLVGLDDFKEMVSAYGPAIGDSLLIRVAQISQVNPSQGEAISCRYGEHDIMLMLKDTSIEAAEQLADWLCAQIAAIAVAEVPGLQVSASIGAYTACFKPDNGSRELTEASFVDKADAQRYIAQRKGKNQVSTAALP